MSDDADLKKKEAFAKKPDTTGAVKVSRPQNGAEYLDSLRDGREVYLYGERVKDVTTHPAFRNTARMVARLYDALHDPKRKDKLTGADRHRQRRHDAAVLQGAEDARGSRSPAATPSPNGRSITYGWMGRAPDYKAAFLATLGANADFYAPYQDNAQALVQVQPGARAVRQSRHHPSAGRSRPAAERSRRCLRAMSRRRPTPASWCPAPRWWRPARC